MKQITLKSKLYDTAVQKLRVAKDSEGGGDWREVRRAGDLQTGQTARPAFTFPGAVPLEKVPLTLLSHRLN